MIKFKFFLITTLLLFLLNSSQAHVSLGIDLIFKKPYFNLIANKRVGLITTNASVNSNGDNSISLFLKNKKIHLVAIFTPEDGLTGSDSIDDIKYKNIPIYSLYTLQKKPTKAQMENLDVIIYDLQSVGVRYYTYITTLALVMQQVKKYHKKMIVLDRPNPINGTVIDGAITDPELLKNFISYYPIPMQYGLTDGELGRYYNKYFIHNVNYTVVPMKHWKRDMLFNQTGLRWIPPTSALPTFNQVFIYGFMGPFEGMNLSVGRGLPQSEKFTYYGAPYISSFTAKKIAEKLEALHLPGVKFTAAHFIPRSAHFKNKICQGIHIQITDYKKVKRFYTFIRVAEIMYDFLGDSLKLENSVNWVGASWVITAIKHQKPANDIIKHAKDETKIFRRNCKKIYLYTQSK